MAISWIDRKCEVLGRQAYVMSAITKYEEKFIKFPKHGSKKQR